MKTIWFLSFLFCSHLFGLVFSISSIDEAILNHTFNDEFDSARIKCREMIAKNPTSPKYYYFEVNLRAIEFYNVVNSAPIDLREETREKYLEDFISFSESAVEKFKDNNLSLDDQFYYGGILGHLGRTYGIKKSWWNAFKTGYDANKIMEKVIEVHPEYYDAYLLMGLLNYYADRLSGFSGFVADVLGFSGNRERGIEYLSLAMNSGKVTFGQAALVLIEVYTIHEDNDEKSLEYFQKFLERYPKNKRILNWYCHILMNELKLAEAGKLIQGPYSKDIDSYGKGRYYHLTGDYQESVQELDKALKEKTRLWRGAGNHAEYLQCVNYFYLNNYAQLFEQKKTLVDELSERLEKELLHPGLFDKMNSLQREISLRNDKKTAESLIKEIKSDSSFEYMKNECYYLFGLYYYRSKNYAAAEKYFSASLNSEGGHLTYLSCKRLIDIYLKAKRTKNEARKIAELVEELDNDRLTFRLRDLKKVYKI
ncbi:MAG: hypothetical protein ABIG69_01250 [Bacteroidota bacterium]